MNGYAPYDSEHAASKAYEELLDECHPAVSIGERGSWDAGTAYRRLDPVGFHCEMLDWINGQQGDNQ